MLRLCLVSSLELSPPILACIDDSIDDAAKPALNEARYLWTFALVDEEE